ncbi:ABC transporter permease [Halegenticoccus tardaugens]|uniref:ABC transporter permease n=1 Tax=Halegenticoccus tardaugens TaxID=2071624 RepID=UPI00100C001B|nr:ABC transporter permease [Halegenticoccus tardaugens]
MSRTSLSEDAPLTDRIAANPRPALVWVAGFALLLALEFGAFAQSVTEPIPWNALYERPAGALGAPPDAVGVVLLVSTAVVAGVGFSNYVRGGSLRGAGVGTLSLLIAVETAIALGGTATLAVVALALLAAVALVGGGVARGEPRGVVVGGLVLLVGLVGVHAIQPLPTLLTRELVPNEGYEHPEDGWRNTFLGLSPAVAWAIRVVLVYAYSFAFLAWCWRGYEVFRRHYRYADWTPQDDMIDRFRTHYWGLFGFVVVFAFVVFAVFAPPLGPTTLEHNIIDPYSNEITHWSDAGGEATITHGEANLAASSTGTSDRNVGVMQYDEYDRFHPFGTLDSGKDLFTFMAAGARVSLFIGVLSIGMSGLVATALALVTAYYKGVADLLTVIVSDSIQSLPRFLLILLLSVVFSGTWIAGVYSGGLLLALIFGATTWPFLWRAVRGPALQVSEQEWIDAARSFGQRPRITMQKHMAPYIVGYLLVYASLTLGGIIIATAALSFLGVGVTEPTPEWGRAVNLGRSYISTVSWHISTIPGVMVVVVVTGFNALGDGIRDAIDPQSMGGGDAADEAAVASGGGG